MTHDEIFDDGFKVGTEWVADFPVMTKHLLLEVLYLTLIEKITSPELGLPIPQDVKERLAKTELADEKAYAIGFMAALLTDLEKNEMQLKKALLSSEETRQ